MRDFGKRSSMELKKVASNISATPNVDQQRPNVDQQRPNADQQSNNGSIRTRPRKFDPALDCG